MGDMVFMTRNFPELTISNRFDVPGRGTILVWEWAKDLEKPPKDFAGIVGHKFQHDDKLWEILGVDQVKGDVAGLVCRESDQGSGNGEGKDPPPSLDELRTSVTDLEHLVVEAFDEDTHQVVGVHAGGLTSLLLAYIEHLDIMSTNLDTVQKTQAQLKQKLERLERKIAEKEPVRSA